MLNQLLHSHLTKNAGISLVWVFTTPRSHVKLEWSLTMSPTMMCFLKNSQVGVFAAFPVRSICSHGRCWANVLQLCGQRVHVFWNCPSTIYGLMRTAMEGEAEFGSETRKFIEHHFYVDNGLKSFCSPEEAVDILCRAQKMLAQCNIHLHKISPNCPAITGAFQSEDLASDMQGHELGLTSPPMQRSSRLGLGPYLRPGQVPDNSQW